MKRVYLSLLCLLFSTLAFSQDLDKASEYYNAGEYEKAALEYEASLPKLKAEHSQGDTIVGYYAYITAICFQNCNDFEKAAIHYSEAKSNYEISNRRKTTTYQIIISNLGYSYYSIGNYNDALICFGDLLKLIEEVAGKNDIEYARVLNNLGAIHHAIGNLEDALRMYSEALVIIENTEGKRSLLYSTTLNNIAQIKQVQGNNYEALRLMIEALNITDENDLNYEIRLNNLAALYHKTNNFEKAEEYYLKAIALTEEKYGKQNTKYCEYIGNLAVLYSDIGLEDKAQLYFNEALQISFELRSQQNPKHISLLNYYSRFLLQKGQIPKAIETYFKVCNLQLISIENNIFSLSENNKLSFLKSKNAIFNEYRSMFYAYQKQSNSTVNFYNLEISLKSMALRSCINTRSEILNSGNNSLIASYDRWVGLKNEIAYQYTIHETNRSTDIKTLEDKAESLETKLNNEVESFQVKTNDKKINWLDIRNSLGPNDVAIEFSSFQFRNDTAWTDSILYVALIIKKEYSAPILIRLFEENSLTKVTNSTSDDIEYINSVYNYNESRINLYDFIWAPLEKYIPEGANIYYSLSGILHQTSLSAIQCPNKKRLSDKYELFCLSSTSKLIEKNRNYSKKDIVLFGGINYNTHAARRKDVIDNNYANNNASRSASIDVLFSDKSWSHLIGTKTEIDSIQYLAFLNNINYSTFSGDLAVEEQIKNLSKPSPRYLHLATHGFFFPNDDNLTVSDETHDDAKYFESSDNPLNRSGLLFSGANEYWKKQERIEGLDDGILTAYEASNLNLWNTELVVLSACETGLGEIKGSEGVFGLQRAFMAAGAEYIIMSLWKVPDAATSEMMTEFYKHLFAGESIPVSFKKAQTQMKNKYPEQPYLWGAFVLVR